jgi:hypothetical protein
MKNFSIVIIAIGVLQYAIGTVFKIQHWPFGNAILITGTIMLAIGIIILLLLQIKTKKKF